MKRTVLIALMLVGIVGSVSAQHDDLYFVPKKKKVKTETVEKVADEAAVPQSESASVTENKQPVKTVAASSSYAKGLEIDEDAYNRRGSYLTEQGDAVSEFTMNDEGFVLITEEGDTMWMNTDTLKLTRVNEDEGWVNGFDGSDSDYEYAMRIVRFRNPRYAIPVSSPLYWDVVYGGALWPSWDWNIYDDGLYAYVFPTASNWLYWDYRMSYPFGWSPWGSHWNHHWGWHYGHHWGGFYGHVWYDPWYDPYFYGYHPGWHHHHGHHGFYPGFGHGKPGWGGVVPGSRPRENDRHATIASTRRGMQDDNAVSRGATSATRRGTTASRTDGGTTRNSSVRVVTGRSSSSDSRASGVVRSSSSRSGSDEVMRRGGTSSSVGRSATTGSSSRSSYTRQSTSRSSSGSSYNRPSSTRSSSSSISRSSSSSRSGSYSSGSSSSSRSSSYSNSSRSGSSYSGGSSYSSSSRSSSSYGGGSSYSGGSSRSSGGSYGGGGGSRSGGSSSGSRR